MTIPAAASEGGLDKLADKRVAIDRHRRDRDPVRAASSAESAKQLYVFQRTPSSVDVRGNGPTDPEWVKSLTARLAEAADGELQLLVNGGHQDEDLVNDGWTDIIRNLTTHGAGSGKAGGVDARRVARDWSSPTSAR